MSKSLQERVNLCGLEGQILQCLWLAGIQASRRKLKGPTIDYLARLWGAVWDVQSMLGHPPIPMYMPVS